eukprot:scaffold205523_cov34-Tisochrysis_lutea.AAC.4
MDSHSCRRWCAAVRARLPEMYLCRRGARSKRAPRGPSAGRVERTYGLRAFFHVAFCSSVRELSLAPRR